MAVTFQIPAGPMNLAPIFPDVNFANVAEYYLEVQSAAGGEVIATTPVYKRACCCGEDSLRIFFVNYLGGIDGINMQIVGEELQTQSEQWKKSLPYPMEKWDGGLQRFNVTSNEEITAENRCYSESDQDWLKELLAAPNAWMQWFGTQGQDNDYIPIVIKDGQFITRKREGRYEYVLQIQFSPANENIILRN